MTSSSSSSKRDEFVEPTTAFEEDDMLSPSDNQHQFLESENFEHELGTTGLEDPFSENFSDIARYNIVDIIADGDLVAR